MKRYASWIKTAVYYNGTSRTMNDWECISNMNGNAILLPSRRFSQRHLFLRNLPQMALCKLCEPVYLCILDIL